MLPDTTILVIDDDEWLLQLVRLILTRENVLVLTATTGEAGVERVRQSPPDLVVVDLHLPGIDGWETCRRIRQLTAAPILILTALESTDERQQLECCGDALLHKPFPLQELREQIQALLAG